jgi:serpin B
MSAQAQQLEPAVAGLVHGNNDFALSLYREIAGRQAGNVLVSPYSISSALAMTYAGARGNTAAEMKTTLRFHLAADRLPIVFGELITQLDGDDEPRPCEFVIANRLWGQKGFGFLPEFVRTCSEYFRAGLAELDFMRDRDAARQTINAWVEQQTNDKIKDLVPPGEIDAQTGLVLTNAIYFKGAWLHPFDASATEPAPFYLTNGATIDTPMMRLTETFPFAAFESFLILQLPYVGQHQSMIILLPTHRDGLAALEEQLCAESLARWLANLSAQSVAVSLPKFKVTAPVSLKNTLQQMGMRDAFIPGRADFRGMAAGARFCISAVLHKAFIDVDEAGTEAAAATAVVMSFCALQLAPTPFIADHPFIYLIRDDTTGSILFAGRLTDPGR